MPRTNADVWDEVTWALWQVQARMNDLQCLYAELGQEPRVAWARAFNESITTALNVATQGKLPA